MIKITTVVVLVVGIYDNNSLRLCIAAYIHLDISNTVFFEFKVNKFINLV